MSATRVFATTTLLTACAAPLEPDVPTARQFPSLDRSEASESGAAFVPRNVDDVLHPTSPLAPRKRVVVIGSGLAGLAVASELHDAVVLEGRTSPGGRANTFGHAAFFFVDTPEQLEEGILDDLDHAIDDWEMLTGAEATAGTVDFLENSHAVYDRLTDLGLSFSLGMQSHPDRLRRQHIVDVAETGLVETIVNGLGEGISVRTEAWVEEVLVGPEGVTGVVVNGERIETDTVVIATGGYVGNNALLQDLLTLDSALWRNSQDSYAQGNALEWAIDGDWATTPPSRIGWLVQSIGLPSEDGFAIEGSERPPPWILIDSNGDRFYDETMVWSVGLGFAVTENWPAWGVTRWDDLLEFVHEDDQDLIEDHRASGLLMCSEDLGALAAAVGFDHQGLLDTLSSVQDHANSPTPDRFGRRSPAPVYQGGELCAFPPGREAAKSFGGLAVGEFGQVLRGDDDATPIKGLFAVGEAAGMGPAGVGGVGGFDGSLSAVMWSGWHTGAYLADPHTAN